MYLRYALYTYASTLHLRFHYSLTLLPAGVRLFPGVGDARGDHPGPQRLQVHRHECLQRRHHLYRGSGRRRHHRERPQLRLPHPLHLHHLLHHSHAVSRLRAEGQCHCRPLWRGGYSVRIIISTLLLLHRRFGNFLHFTLHQLHKRAPRMVFVQ